VTSHLENLEIKNGQGTARENDKHQDSLEISVLHFCDYYANT